MFAICCFSEQWLPLASRHCSFPIFQALSLKRAMKAYSSQSYWQSHYSLWLGRILLFSQMLYLLRIRNHFYVIKNYRSLGSILFLLGEENLRHWTWYKPSFSQAQIKQVILFSPPTSIGSSVWRRPNWKEGTIGLRLKHIRANQSNQIVYEDNELCKFNLDVVKELSCPLFILEIFLNTALFFWAGGFSGGLEGNRIQRITRTAKIC